MTLPKIPEGLVFVSSPNNLSIRAIDKKGLPIIAHLGGNIVQGKIKSQKYDGVYSNSPETIEYAKSLGFKVALTPPKYLPWEDKDKYSAEDRKFYVVDPKTKKNEEIPEQQLGVALKGGKLLDGAGNYVKIRDKLKAKSAIIPTSYLEHYLNNYKGRYELANMDNDLLSTDNEYYRSFAKGGLEEIGKLADINQAAGAGITAVGADVLSKGADLIGAKDTAKNLKEFADEKYDAAKNHWDNPVIEKAIGDTIPTYADYTTKNQIARGSGGAVGSIATINSIGAGFKLATAASGINKLPWVKKMNDFLHVPVTTKNVKLMATGGAGATYLKSRDSETSAVENFTREMLGWYLGSEPIPKYSVEALKSLWKATKKTGNFIKSGFRGDGGLRAWILSKKGMKINENYLQALKDNNIEVMPQLIIEDNTRLHRVASWYDDMSNSVINKVNSKIVAEMENNLDKYLGEAPNKSMHTLMSSDSHASASFVENVEKHIDLWRDKIDKAYNKANKHIVNEEIIATNTLKEIENILPKLKGTVKATGDNKTGKQTAVKFLEDFKKELLNVKDDIYENIYNDMEKDIKISHVGIRSLSLNIENLIDSLQGRLKTYNGAAVKKLKQFNDYLNERAITKNNAYEKPIKIVEIKEALTAAMDVKKNLEKNKVNKNLISDFMDGMYVNIFGDNDRFLDTMYKYKHSVDIREAQPIANLRELTNDQSNIKTLLREANTKSYHKFLGNIKKAIETDIKNADNKEFVKLNNEANDLYKTFIVPVTKEKLSESILYNKVPTMPYAYTKDTIGINQLENMVLDSMKGDLIVKETGSEKLKSGKELIDILKRVRIQNDIISPMFEKGGEFIPKAFIDTFNNPSKDTYMYSLFGKSYAPLKENVEPLVHSLNHMMKELSYTGNSKNIFVKNYLPKYFLAKGASKSSLTMLGAAILMETIPKATANIFLQPEVTNKLIKYARKQDNEKFIKIFLNNSKNIIKNAIEYNFKNLPEDASKYYGSAKDNIVKQGKIHVNFVKDKADKYVNSPNMQGSVYKSYSDNISSNDAKEHFENNKKKPKGKALNNILKNNLNY